MTKTTKSNRNQTEGRTAAHWQTEQHQKLKEKLEDDKIISMSK